MSLALMTTIIICRGECLMYSVQLTTAIGSCVYIKNVMLAAFLRFWIFMKF